MAWFKANDGGFTVATIKKALALPSEYWLQVDVYVPTSTLTACPDHDLGGSTTFLAELGFASLTDGIFGIDVNYPLGVWKWESFVSPGAAGTVTPDTTHTLKVHVNGTTVSWFADGVLLFTYTRTTARDGFALSRFGRGCICEVYFYSNVKVGTSDGGSDLFADDFSGGDFSNWTTVEGPAVIVAAPTQCVTPTIMIAPTRACRGDNVFISGSGFAPNSAITLLVQGSLDPVTFSEATTDAGGNVSGYFSMPDGFEAVSTTNVYIEDAAGNTSLGMPLDVCCNVSADGLDSTTPGVVGPEVAIPNVEPLDYVHADGAHWVLWQDSSSIYPNTETLPPPPNHTLNLTRISDDGLSVTTYLLDTGYAWRFNDSVNSFLFCQNWQTSLYFGGWDKPVYDARLASDGTTVWAVVLTAETVPYPYLSTDDGHCGEPSQSTQFVDLATLTSGFTVFPTSPGAGGAPYERVYHNSDGALNIYTPDFPNSDGGDHWFGYWNPPRVVVFAGGGGGFSRIGDLVSLYYGGNTSAVGNDRAIIGGPVLRNDGPRGRFLSGLSVAAAAAEPGICHVVWAEGGAWGRCGAGLPGGTVATVWDGDQPNQDYRVNYSRWDAGGNVLDTDLWHNHIDRTSWWFPFETDGDGSVYRNGYSWPTAASLAAANDHALKNEHGSPALFLSWLLTHIGPSPIGAQVDSAGNPWLDNSPSFAEATLRYYDLTSGAATLLQTLDASLLPTAAELNHKYVGAVVPNRLTDSWGSGSARAFSLSLLYTDPTLAGAPVYAFMIPWKSALYDANGNVIGVGYDSLGVYRIVADGSGPFDLLDGTRLLGYSITIPSYRGGEPPPGDFFSDAKNVWQPSSLGEVFELDRMCLRQWSVAFKCPNNFSPLPRFTSNNTGLYYDEAADTFYYAGFSVGSSFQIASVHIRRGCRNCACPGAAGLHVSKRLLFSKN